MPGEATPTTRRVARNTAFRAAAEILGKLATLALTIVMLDQLGKGAVGDFAFAFAITQVYWAVAGFGLDRVMLHDIAKDPSATARLVPMLNAFKLTVGGLCIVVGTLLVGLTQHDATLTWTLLILGFTLVATLIGATAQSVFMAKERTQDYFVAALPVKVFGALIGIAVLLVGGGIIAVATTSLIAALLGIAIGWWILARRYHQPPAGLAGTPRTWWPMARRAAPWGIQEVFGQLMFRFGIIALYLYAGRDVTGEYRTAYQLLEASLFLPWSVGTSILPLIARAQKGASDDPDRPSLQVVSGATIEVVVALMVPLAVILSLCAYEIISLYPGDVIGAADYLPLLAIASVVYGVGHIAGLVALSHLPGRRTVEITAVAAAVSMAAVLLLVPPYAGWGAAAAALITETVLTGLSLYLAVKAGGRDILRGLLSIGVVAGIVMALVVLPFRHNLPLAIVLGGAAYCIVFVGLEYRRQGPAWALLRSFVPGSA
jgi:O-antigen/teichoic acid export membrane protein